MPHSNPYQVGMLILMEHDLEAAVEFYQKLGLSLKFHLKERWAEFAIGPVKLGLCPTETEPFQRHTGIVLAVTDLQKTYQELKAKEIEFLMAPKVAPHGIMVGLIDPNGNIIDLYQPTPEKMQEMAHQTVRHCCNKSETKTNCCH